MPDGYTLFAPAISLFISLPGKAPNLPLILPRDFLPVASLVDQPIFICASANSGIKTLPELIARAKTASRPHLLCGNRNRTDHTPDRLASANAGPGIKLQVVPYPAARRPH